MNDPLTSDDMLRAATQPIRRSLLTPPIPAIYFWSSGGLNIAIPKRRGTGYLAQPLGHHYVEALSDIENSEHIDICGLDGYLALEYRYTNLNKRAEIVARVMPRLAKHFRFAEWREDEREFWRIVQRDKAG